MNNVITLVGRVGADPVEFQFENSKLVKFPLAVKEFNKEDGKDFWIDIEGWNAAGTRIKAHATKGREVVVTGRLAKSKPYTNNEGVLVIEPVLKLLGFYLCGKKPQTQDDAPAVSTKKSVPGESVS